MNTAILTIDHIPSRNTPAIVDMLCEKGIKAVLFATGQHLEQYPEEAAYAVTHGMIVGNHSYSHPAFSTLTLQEARQEIDRCEQLLNGLYAACGIQRLYRPFRFPYGDKGGELAPFLQQYLKQSGFHKLDDRHIPYAWWQENGLHEDIDTFWTFDFEEYRMQSEPDFTPENIWHKVNDRNPAKGAALFGENQRHIILTHAHDETEEILPGYCRQFVEYLMKNGITFDEPCFL